MADYVVRYGAMRLLGAFSAAAGRECRRGMQVIVRTDRGLEIGEVLCDATPATNGETKTRPAGRFSARRRPKTATNLPACGSRPGRSSTFARRTSTGWGSKCSWFNVRAHLRRRADRGLLPGRERGSISANWSGQRPDQFAEIDPRLGQVVDHDPLAAEDVLNVDQLHFQPEPVDVLLANVELLPGLLPQAGKFVAVFGRRLAENLPAGRSLVSPLVAGVASQSTSPISRPRSVRTITCMPRRHSRPAAAETPPAAASLRSAPRSQPCSLVPGSTLQCIGDRRHRKERVSYLDRIRHTPRAVVGSTQS